MMSAGYSTADGPRPQPLSAIQRRVVGVLAEKAKTTPENYPMTLNAIVTACNQKNNRFPITAYEAEEVEEALDQLREIGAVAMIEGVGRVPKYRHLLYQWLGVEKVELAVMTELLLRGAQTEGELRSRAARMEPIADLTALRPVLDSLKSKGLVISLTPPGRGHVVTHNLYKLRELEELKRQFEGRGETTEFHSYAASGTEGQTIVRSVQTDGVASSSDRALLNTPARMSSMTPDELPNPVQATIDALRADIERLRSEAAALNQRQMRLEEELQRLRHELGCD